MSYLANNSAMARINAVVDENSFVEIGGMVTARSTDFNMRNKETPGDGVITGYGVVEGKIVYIYSQDASVLGGTVGEMHAKKILKIYDMAMKVGAPIVAMVDCAGLRLQEAMDAMNAFGEIYLKQVLASGVIPQITAVFGTCGGGMGIASGLSDFSFMADNGKLFINSPNALDGNEQSRCDTASAEYNALNGTVDFVASEEDVLTEMRKLIAVIPSNNEDEAIDEDCFDDLNRVCEGIEGYAADTSRMLSIISDGGFVIETKKEYAKEMVTAFIKLNGATVGVVANRTEQLDDALAVKEKYEPVLTVEGCKKAAKFVNYCDAFGIPVVTLTNVSGFKGTKEQEKEMATSVARLTASFANATVPKVNLIIGDAFGNAYNVMNSKALGADVVYAWPQAKVGTMDAENAVRIMYADEIANSEDKLKLISEKKAEYESLKESAIGAAKRGYIDSVIEPVDTRKYIIGALEMLYTKADERPVKKHSTI